MLLNWLSSLSQLSELIKMKGLLMYLCIDVTNYWITIVLEGLRSIVCINRLWLTFSLQLA